MRHNWPHPSKSGGLRSSFLLLTSYMKKLRYHLLLSRDTDDERILEQRHKWLNQKRYSLDDYHHAEIAWFLTEILMIEESCNHIGQEAQLATSNQKWQSWMCPFFDDFLHAKNLRGRLILSRNIDDQRILQSD